VTAWLAGHLRRPASGRRLRATCRARHRTFPRRMKQVTLDEIVGLERYEEIRPEFRRRIIEMKKSRRVPVGDRVTFVFESHDTMLFQIQEMLRAEHIVDIEAIREELEVYNALVPGPGELSSTMFIEITESDMIRESLLRFTGVEKTVSIRVGERRIAGEFEGGRSKEDKLSAVQYVRFAFDDEARAAFVAGQEPVRLVIDHPHYRHEAAIEGSVREALRGDLGEP
jgi:hypothetical protein